MTKLGGRDTEKDFFGNNGGYKTVMSKNNAGLPCPACSSLIKKENFMGGSVYFCMECQKLNLGGFIIPFFWLRIQYIDRLK